jgi:hypothetical protein
LNYETGRINPRDTARTDADKDSGGDCFDRGDRGFRACAAAPEKIERTIVADNLMPLERGPRNNMVLIVCAIPIVVVALLLFLIINT